MSENPPEGTSASLVVRPGDTFIVGYGRPLGPDTVQRLRERLREHLGADVKILILDEVAHMGVYRPDGRKGSA